MSPNAADGKANSVDPDQTAPLGAVWSGSALFAQTCLSENLGQLRYTKFSNRYMYWVQNKKIHELESVKFTSPILIIQSHEYFFPSLIASVVKWSNSVNIYQVYSDDSLEITN